MRNILMYAVVGGAIYYFWWKRKKDASNAAIAASLRKQNPALMAPRQTAAPMPSEGEVGVGY